MKFRNLVGSAALVLAVCMSASVYAAGVEITCPQCKTDVKHVPLPTAVVSQTSTTCNPNTFDYDNVATSSYLGLHTGYCDGTGAGQGTVNENIENYRAIMAICDCISGGVAANRFDANDVIGIRMTLLVDGKVNPDAGVYWQGTTPSIAMDTYSGKTQACEANSYTKSFGTVSYYTVTEPGTSTTPGAAPTTCSPAANQKLITLQSAPLSTQGYTVTQADVDAQVSYWGIDIPPVIVTAAAKAGSKVSVKIELLDANSAGICSSCTPLCHCTIDIAILGCEGGAISTCVSFPYVVTQINETSGWSTGIAIANLDEGVTAPTLTFKLTDSKGAVFTATKGFTDKVGAWMLDDILTNWTWSPSTMPVPGAAMLQVSGNFNLDGYEFMSDGNFGAGTLPRTTCK